MKLEKVIKGLESIHAVALDKEQLYVNHMSMKDFNELLADAAELLKKAGCFAEEGDQYFACGRKVNGDDKA